MRFYLERCDLTGHRAITAEGAWVVAAELVQDRLHITTPAGFCQTRPLHTGWLDVDGPARPLTEAEYVELLYVYESDRTRILAAEQRLTPLEWVTLTPPARPYQEG